MEFMRVKHVAQYMGGIGVSTVWLYVKQGKLHPIKLSKGVTVFAKSEIDVYIESRKNGVLKD